MAVTDDQEYGQRTMNGAPPQVSLYAPTPAPPPKPVVVDRVAYLQAQDQARKQAAIVQQQLDAFNRATYNVQNAGRNAQLQPLVQPLTDPNLYDNRRTDPLAPDPTAGYRIRRPEPTNLLNAGASVAGQVAQTGLDVATAEIPGASRLQQTVGEGASRLASVPYPTDVIPGLDTRPVREKAAQFIGEALIPTEVWDTALTLLPVAKAKTPLEAASALILGDTDVISALRAAGERAGKSESVERGLAKLASETGALGGKGEPEDILRAGARAAEDVASGGPSAGGSALPSSPVPAEVIAALKNRNAAIAKDPEAFAQAWELLPAENQKMIVKMADAVLTPAERKAITRAGQARQTARARTAIEETAGTTLERAQAARQAMTGRYIPQISPIGESFSVEELSGLFRQIDEAFDARKLIPQEHANATDAMELLMYGKRPLSPEKPLSLMPHEIKLLGRIYGPEFEAILPKTKRELSLFQKAIDIANLPRAIISGIDVSAPGRQGIMLAARNPVEWGKAWGPMVKSMLSETRYTKEIELMQGDAYFEDAVLHGIDFTDIGGGHTAEEAFQTHLVQDNPILRNTIGRGERGYTVYLDKLRLEVYKKGAARLERTAAKHGWEAERLDLAKKDFAGFVNHASGRGDLGALNQYVPALNAIFFSPRFVVSRPQTIYDLMKSDPAVRQMVGENLGAFVGTGVLLLTAVAASGLARVELNPRSSDFGKMRFGNQRIEFWGGWQPLARYIAQVATGERKTLSSGEIVGVNRGKTVGRFIRSKLSPAGALGWDITIEGGKNYEGENFLTPKQLPQEAVNRLTPLVIQDAIEGYRAQGPAAVLSAAAVSTVGGGVGTFEESEKEQKAAEKSKAEEEFNKQFPDVAKIPDAALAAVRQEFPTWEFKGETYEEAIAQIKADAEARGVRYQDTNIYKALSDAVEERNMNARRSDPKIDAYWVAYKGAKPLSVEAQQLAKEMTGITVELSQDAR